MARRKDAFLVNLWRELRRDESGHAEWRGSVEHLASRRRLYFTGITDLVTFLSDYTRDATAREGDLDA
jgi:hypothetical protein